LAPNYITQSSTLRPANWGNLIAEALAITNYDTQKKLNQKLVKTLVDDATVIPLWATPSYIAKVKNLHNDGLLIDDTWYWTPENAWVSK